MTHTQGVSKVNQIYLNFRPKRACDRKTLGSHLKSTFRFIICAEGYATVAPDCTLFSSSFFPLFYFNLMKFCYIAFLITPIMNDINNSASCYHSEINALKLK